MRISDWSSDVCSSDLALRVRNVHAFHPETTTSVQGRRARILQRWIIIIIEIIYPDDVFAPVQQPVRHAVANEASSAGNNDRSEERSVGKECVSTCRSRWSP